MSIEIRSVADFVDVPEDQLARCLQAFRLTILRVKADRLAAANKVIAPGRIPFDLFVWRPRQDGELDSPVATPTLPIDELPLRCEARLRLKEMRVYCLEDFSEVTEREFLVLPDVGRLTVERIRGMLEQIGLEFKPDTDPVRALVEANRLARKVPPAERLSQVTDESGISTLGLAPAILRRAMRKGHLTVAALRNQPLRKLSAEYGKQQVKEILDVLAQAGLALQPAPSALDLWRAGLARAEELEIPRDPQTDVASAAPWLGYALTERLRRTGVVTLQNLADRCASASADDLHWLGRRTREKVLLFLRRAGLLERTAMPDLQK